jgi:putative OPT family oligopeptide transporter
MQQIEATSIHPYISSVRSLPEITVKGVLLGIVLAMIMGGANAYLGLKVGSTVSACIPAAVISMAVLRLFKQSNILENNIVQTIASGGEVIAMGTIFTLPALVMIGYWDHFSLLLTTCLTTLGGLLGVMISVPLRRALIIENPLRFPEGVATAEVLQAGEHKETSEAHMQNLLWGGVWSAFIKFLQTGMQICSESFHCWTHAGSTVIGVGGGYSLAIIGSGYIVGLRSCIGIALGGSLAWLIGVPLYGLMNGLPEGDSPAQIASTIWGSDIRMMGVGAMVVGGIWTIVSLIEPIRSAIYSSLKAFQKATVAKRSTITRTDRDIPFPYVFGGTLILGFLMMGVIYHIFHTHALEVSGGLMGLSVLIVTVLVLLVGFLCSCISGYMTGIIGSSNNPISGVTLISILIFSGVLLFLLDSSLNFSHNPARALQAAGTVVLIGCVVACAAAVSGDNLQDLKSGQLVGSTPWKQQVALMVGVVAGSITMAPVMELLFQAYGIGKMMPRIGMDPMHALAAPKAAMMATLSQSIFMLSMKWSVFFVGASIALVVIFLDHWLKRQNSGWRLPVLGVAVGIYMPLEVTVPFVIGGFLSYAVERAQSLKKTRVPGDIIQRRSVLICAGFIAGESLLGVILAGPFAFYQSSHVFRLVPKTIEPFTGVLGLGVTAWVVYRFYQKVIQD